MNVLIQLSHPAHFHLYKNIARGLMEDGHQVLFVIKSKDILEQLLIDAGLPYVNINQHAHRGSKLGILWDMFVREWRIIKLCRKHKIDLITGSTPETAHVSWLLRIHGVNSGEDDAAVVPAFGKVTAPFIQCLVVPIPCNTGSMERNTVHYPGYHELAYLHPNHFTPDPMIVEAYGIDTSKPYFVMRFASLNAHHDSGIKGINTEIAQRLIDILEGSGLDHFESDPSQLVPFSSNSSPNNSTKGTSLTPSEACSLSETFVNKLVPQTTTDSSQLVPLDTNSLTTNSTSGNKPRIYITSERPLEPQFEKYRIKINPLDMHHVMAFASLYIGDSQTMAAEAGVLGVPFVRFNDFVGRIGYLRELEDVYELGYGIHATPLTTNSSIRRNDGSVQPSGVEELYKRVEQLVSMPSDERRAIFQSRRQKMLSEKIDCAKFLTWFIENYPQSAEQTRKADISFWDRFK